ncbi:DUF2062 domain-containing protein [Candidatus Nitrospira bockiana]
MVSLAQLRSHLQRLLHLRESPHRTALAFAVGVFIAFSPTYGLHTLMVLFCTWALRLNFLALMAGALLNNPWTIVPILGATLWTGFQVLGMPTVEPIVWNDFSAGALYRQVLPYLLPFFVGGVVLSLFGAVVGYPAAYWLISRYRPTRPPQPDDPLPTSVDVR